MKAAVIGLGSMGKVHLDVVKTILKFDSICACDISEERVKTLKEEYSDIKFYTDMTELFEKEKVDFVSIVTLGKSHLEIVEKAIKSGVKYILCEKPIATSIKDAQKIIDLAKENDVKLVINQSRRGLDFYKTLKDGALKDIGGAKFFYFSTGGGRLGSAAIHIFDLFRYLSGKEYVSVEGILDPTYAGDHKGRDVFDPGASMFYMMEDNTRCFMDVTDDIGTGFFILISGPFGRITINEHCSDAYVECRSEEDKKKRLGQYTLPLIKTNLNFPSIDLRKMTKEMIEDLLKGKILCSGEDGLKALEAVLGAHYSVKEGKRINFPLKENTFEVDIT